MLPGASTVLLALLFATACATSPPAPDALPARHLAVSGFDFPDDSFAFANQIRARHPEADDLYANYCFVLARALRQFHQFARFDPALPRLDAGEYVVRVRQVVARPPWEPAVAPSERVVIPGYRSLRDFSGGEEPAVKEGLGGRFWTLVHWTNWRITFPVGRRHQEGVLDEVLADLAAGRLVQLLVTNWPTPELNHTVVAFAAGSTAAGVELEVWDPNDPARPGLITFDRARGGFRATRLHDTRPGPIRVFRMYHSPWL